MSDALGTDHSPTPRRSGPLVSTHRWAALCRASGTARPARARLEKAYACRGAPPGRDHRRTRRDERLVYGRPFGLPGTTSAVPHAHASTRQSAAPSPGSFTGTGCERDEFMTACLGDRRVGGGCASTAGTRCWGGPTRRGSDVGAGFAAGATRPAYPATREAMGKASNTEVANSVWAVRSRSPVRCRGYLLPLVAAPPVRASCSRRCWTSRLVYECTGRASWSANYPVAAQLSSSGSCGGDHSRAERPGRGGLGGHAGTAFTAPTWVNSF